MNTKDFTDEQVADALTGIGHESATMKASMLYEASKRLKARRKEIDGLRTFAGDLSIETYQTHWSSIVNPMLESWGRIPENIITATKAIGKAMDALRTRYNAAEMKLATLEDEAAKDETFRAEQMFKVRAIVNNGESFGLTPAHHPRSTGASMTQRTFKFTDVTFEHAGIAAGDEIDIVSDYAIFTITLRWKHIEAVYSKPFEQESVTIRDYQETEPVDIVLWTHFLRYMRDLCRKATF